MTQQNDPANHPLLVVISGPSGVGKDSVLDELKRRETPFYYVVTATTRPMRPGEVHGVNYWFYPVAEFEKLLKAGELLENAVVYGNFYGIPKDPVRQALKRGEDVIMRIDVQGATHIKRILPDALFIFLAPPNFQAIIDRLGHRNTETPESLKIRLEKYYQEMESSPIFDYLVINRDGELDDTVDKIISIITAEKLRTHPRRVTL